MSDNGFRRTLEKPWNPRNWYEHGPLFQRE